MTVNIQALSAEFPRDAVSWRAQSVTKNGDKALALAYIDARDVMGRLDEVCGPENWEDSYVETAKGRVIATIRIRTAEGWVAKSDGAGDTDVEGDKGGISDAFKRAAVKWGIGRYLYAIAAPWVPCESYETEYQGKKKQNWKSWKVDPWTMVRGGSATPAASQPAKPTPSSFQSHIDAMNASGTLADLQTAFQAAKADKSLTSDEAERVIVRKDAIKSAFTKSVIAPNFDDLEPNIPYPPATQAALDNLRAG